MKFIRETCIAGPMIMRTVKCVSSIGSSKRKAKKNITRESARKWNDRQAVKKAEMLVYSNFNPNDLHVVLTYAEVVSPEEALKKLKNFIKKMRRYFRSIDREFKYFVVTEFDNHRIHHHMIMSDTDYKVINQKWSEGAVRMTPLYDNYDYHGLVEYLVKETTKTFRNPDNVFKHRYMASRNLDKPQIVIQEVPAKELLGEYIKEIKGYSLIRDSIVTYENPLTGIPHIEYRYIADDVMNPRLKKKWKTGKVKKRNESFIRFEKLKQLNLFDDYEYRLV